jgi:ABC-2 type transport system permease protein
VAETLRNFRLWRVLVAARMRAQAQYRASFAFNVLASAFLTALDFVAMLAIFTHLHSLGDWSVHDVAFLYGAGGIGFALADLFTSNLEKTAELVRTGQFDVVLIRPAGPLTQVLAGDVSLRSIGKVAQAAAALAFALSGIEVAWNPGRVLMTLVIVVCGALIFSAIFIGGSCIAFATVDGGEATNAVTYGGNYFTQYPLDVFGPWLRRFLGFVVPTAFVAYFPALYVLDKPMPFGLPAWLRFASPIVTVIALIVSLVIWRLCVRSYRSTGS